MSQAFGFISHKEVVVAPWTKKPDVEIIDPSGEFLNIYLDITLPALHQNASKTQDSVYKTARTAKTKQYPHKDHQGRLINTSVCVPFIITSMGGLCKEGHEFLRICRKKDVEKTQHMIDVLITQHAKWTARRIKRSLFGQALIDFSKDSWSRVPIDNDTQRSTQKRGINLQQKCIPRLARQFSSFSVVDDSQGNDSNEGDEVDSGDDSDESEDHMQTLSTFSDPANSKETEHPDPLFLFSPA